MCSDKYYLFSVKNELINFKANLYFYALCSNVTSSASSNLFLSQFSCFYSLGQNSFDKFQLQIVPWEKFQHVDPSWV